MEIKNIYTSGHGNDLYYLNWMPLYVMFVFSVFGDTTPKQVVNLFSLFK